MASENNSTSQESALEDIPLDELLRLAIQDRLIDLHVALPARVESYDHSTQTVSCTPMINRYVPDGNEGYISETLPILADVPVKFQRCQQFTMTFPLVKGDQGMLVFNERNISAWRSTGNQGDPGDVGTHTLDGAVFVPGLMPDSMASSTASDTNMVLGSETDGNSRIELRPSGGINLGAGASKGVARDGDHGLGGTLTINFAGTGTVSGSYTDPDGTTTPWAAGAPIALKTKLNEGSAHVKAVD